MTTKVDAQGYYLYSVNDVLRTATDYDGRKKWIAKHKSKLSKLDNTWWGRASVFGKHRTMDMKDMALVETFKGGAKENELPSFYDEPPIPKLGDLLGELRVVEGRAVDELKQAEAVLSSVSPVKPADMSDSL